MDMDERKETIEHARKEEEKEDKKGKKKKEESYEVLENMARVLPAQLQYITFKENSRYIPVKSVCDIIE